jgi:hypothetical protein
MQQTFAKASVYKARQNVPPSITLIREHSNNECVLIWNMYKKKVGFYNCLISSFAFSTVKASGITFLSKTMK